VERERAVGVHRVEREVRNTAVLRREAEDHVGVHVELGNHQTGVDDLRHRRRREDAHLADRVGAENTVQREVRPAVLSVDLGGTDPLDQ
jgi:hypothetical protein